MLFSALITYKYGTKASTQYLMFCQVGKTEVKTSQNICAPLQEISTLCKTADIGKAY